MTKKRKKRKKMTSHWRDHFMEGRYYKTLQLFRSWYFVFTPTTMLIDSFAVKGCPWDSPAFGMRFSAALFTLAGDFGVGDSGSVFRSFFVKKRI